MQIAMRRGDSLKFPVHLLVGGVYQSMVGGTLYFTLKNNFEDPDASAVYQNSWAGTGTETWVHIPGTETTTWLENPEPSRNYYGDVKFISGDSPPLQISGEIDVLVGYTVTQVTT